MPLYYYLIAIPLFALIGALSHVLRAVFNVFPDRGFGRNPDRSSYSFTDDFLSSNYSYLDHLVGTEYDENGYYDLYSLKNLRLACQFSVGGGVLALLILPELPEHFRQGVDFSADWLWQLWLFRLQTFQLF